MSPNLNLVVLLYLVASVCFIQALKGLSHPTTSIRGNVFGMVGMTIAVVTTVGLIAMMTTGVAGGPSLRARLCWVVLRLGVCLFFSYHSYDIVFRLSLFAISCLKKQYSISYEAFSLTPKS